MNDADERVAHHDDVQVRRGQRTRKLAQRLIRQAAYVRERVPYSEVFDFRVFAAPTDKAEDDVVAGSQSECGGEQRVERMTRAVIARVHHDEAIRESVLLA